MSLAFFKFNSQLKTWSGTSCGLARAWRNGTLNEIERTFLTSAENHRTGFSDPEQAVAKANRLPSPMRLVMLWTMSPACKESSCRNLRCKQRSGQSSVPGRRACMRTRTVVNNDDLLTRCADKIDRPCYATSKASRLRAAGIAANQQKVQAQEIRRRRRW